MVLYSFTNGTLADADQVNSTISFLLSETLKNNINYARISVGSSLGSQITSGSSYINIFNNNTGVDVQHLIYTGSSWTTIDISGSDSTFIDIYAGSVSPGTLTDTGSSLYCYRVGSDSSTGSDVYRLYSSGGAGSVSNQKRALVKLFHGVGSDVSDPNGVTNLYDLRFNNSEYQGSKLYYMDYQLTTTGGLPGTALFTTTNSGSNVLITDYFAGAGEDGKRLEAPNGTVIHSSTTDHRYDSTVHVFVGSDISVECDDTSGGANESIDFNGLMITSGSMSAVKTGPVPGTFLYSGSFDISGTAPDTTNFPLFGSSVLEMNTFVYSTNASALLGVEEINLENSGSSTISRFFSVNAGTTYESATRENILNPSGTGSRIKYKVDILRTGSDHIDSIESVGFYVG